MADSNSGYFSDSFEGIGSSFTELATLHEGVSNVVMRAKRYGRWWVLKSLADTVAEQELYRQRLRKEFEILISLQHPDVVGAVGLEEVKGLGTCIVMEYVDGQTLGEWLQSNPSISRRKRVARQIIQAVGYLHSKGVVHRDLKPSNILVSHNGDSVKLIDFGLADTDSHTVMKQPAGTPGYMSPEQAEIDEADVRNDIYSLGVLFREMELGYGKVIDKCVGGIEGRYENVDSLMEALKRKENLKKRYFAVGALTVAATLVVTGIVIAGNRFGRQNDLEGRTEVINTEVLPQDSSSDSSADSPDRLAPSTDVGDGEASGSTPVVSMEPSDQASKIPSSEKEALERGKRMVDRMFEKATYPQYIDTLTSILYWDPKLAKNTISIEMSKAVEEFVEGLGDSFSQADKVRINSTLQNYCLQKIAPVDAKMIKLLQQKDEIETSFGN